MQPPSAGPAIVASKTDPASLNIARSLIKHHDFALENPNGSNVLSYQSRGASLYILEKEGISVQPEDLPVSSSSIIFASKHRSSTNTPALTVHATGNLTREAKYGGNPEQVSLVEPFRIRQALMILRQEAMDAGLTIEVTMEATHHGPTSFPVPICFVEIGSENTQWEDPILGDIAAEAVTAALAVSRDQRTNAVGFGGTHYSDKLTRLCAESDFQIGHIVPRHAFDADVSDRMVRDTFQKTVGVCKTALVDWKGLKGEQRRILLANLASWGVEVVKC